MFQPGDQVGPKNTHWRHGRWGTRTHRIWVAMRCRCNNPKMRRYHRYGGRGIKVCDRWASFEQFLADMGEAPAGMSIEREDNDGDYEPGNCRWATPTEQGANTVQNRMITHGGETMHLSAWARKFGTDPSTLRKRIKRGEFR